VPRQIIEGSQAVAKAVRLCSPKVIATYPITPSTHIPETLAKMKADGELDATLMMTESEFSAISAVVGASATGVRAYTATSSQGLALMHEVLYAAAGMRLPIVINVVNRALSAPLNIFNDQQDSIAERDAGWVQLYAATNQEAVDTTIQAFRIAEQALLPVMVCTDGFYLSHTYEVIDVPDGLKGFLPEYKPTECVLDPGNPMTVGAWAMPEPYLKLRKELNDAVDGSGKAVKGAHNEFAKKFGRRYGDGLVETKGKGSVAFVSMGSLCQNLQTVCEEKRMQLVRVRCYRPFPAGELRKALKNARTIIVVEKDVAYGMKGGALYNDLRSALKGSKARIASWVVGLGGVDVTVDYLRRVAARAKSLKDGEVVWQHV